MKNKKDKRWYGFMATDKFVVFMNIMRVLTFIGIGVLVYIMLNNIEEVMIIADPCLVCMQKADVTCFGRLNLG